MPGIKATFKGTTNELTIEEAPSYSSKAASMTRISITGKVKTQRQKEGAAKGTLEEAYVETTLYVELDHIDTRTLARALELF